MRFRLNDLLTQSRECARPLICHRLARTRARSLPMLHDLKSLAQEKSSEKRLALLRKISALFLAHEGSHSEAEEYLFGEIVDRLVGEFAKPEKLVVSRTMAKEAYFPRQAALRLARDSDIEIAEPVLAHSPSLTEEDLVELAGSGSQDHLRAIAGRSFLPESVTDVLIHRGDRRVVQAVSENRGAAVSQSGMNHLIEKARDDIDLRELLVERPDLSQAAVNKLLPLVSAQLAARLAERGFDVGDRLPPDMLATIGRRLTHALRERRNEVRDTAMLIESVRKGRLSIDEAAFSLAEADRLVDLATLLAPFANVDRNYLFGLISRGQFQALLILFRAIGLAWPTVERILTRREEKRGNPLPLRPELRVDYAAIDGATAQRTLRFIHVRRAAG